MAKNAGIAAMATEGAWRTLTPFAVPLIAACALAVAAAGNNPGGAVPYAGILLVLLVLAGGAGLVARRLARERAKRGSH